MMSCIIAIFNFEGLTLDVVGVHADDTTSQNSRVQALRQIVKKSLNHNINVSKVAPNNQQPVHIDKFLLPDKLPSAEHSVLQLTIPVQ